MLPKLVYEIVQSQPAGIKHVEVVKEILRRGYTHQDNQPLSKAVYETLKSLVMCGVISRSQDELLERRYKTCEMACVDITESYV